MYLAPPMFADLQKIDCVSLGQLLNHLKQRQENRKRKKMESDQESDRESEGESDCEEFSFTCDKCAFVTKDLQEIKKHTREHKKKNTNNNTSTQRKNNIKSPPTKKPKHKRFLLNKEKQISDSEISHNEHNGDELNKINLSDKNKDETYQIADEINFFEANINSNLNIPDENYDEYLLNSTSFFEDNEALDESSEGNFGEEELSTGVKSVKVCKSHGIRTRRTKSNYGKEDSEADNEFTNSVNGEKDNLFKCTKCSFSADSNELLTRHERIHQHAKVAEDKIACDECEIDFEIKKDLVVHEFEVHNKPVPPAYHYLINPSKCKILPDRYKCSYNSCDFSCKFLYMLTNHKNKKHRTTVPKPKAPRKLMATEVKEDRYQCSSCGFVCKYKKLLQKHNQETHKKAKGPKIGKRASGPGQHCEYCKRYIVGSKNHYIRHMCIHTGEKPFSCEDCGKCYTEKASLNQHKLTHREANDYLCEDCGKAFKRAINLRMHKRIHLKGKPHECSLCDYKCRRRDSLGLHMKRKHLKEKRYLCDHCGKGFFSDQERSQHLKRKHLPRPMPFVCPICQEPFKFEYNMRAHLKTHPNYKPNKCSYCDFETRTKAALKDHIKKHTGEKTKSCDLCSYVTSTSSNLYKHRKRNHGINSIRPISKLSEECATVILEIGNQNQSQSTDETQTLIPLDTIKEALNTQEKDNKYTSNVISQALAEARIAQSDVYETISPPPCPSQVNRPSQVQVLPQGLVSSLVSLTPSSNLSLATNIPIIPSTTIPCSMNSMFSDNIVGPSPMAANLVVAAAPHIPSNGNYYTNLMNYNNLQ